MSMSCKVTRIPVIQLRFISYAEDGRELYGWNKKFQRPHVAADHWARNAYNEWRNHTIKRIGISEFTARGWDEWKYRQDRLAKLTRRSLPIFRQMLK